MAKPSAAARYVRTALFDLDPDAARSDVRGFAATAADKRARLEDAGASFITGYRAAIRTADPREAAAVCADVAPLLGGFAFEGAAMGLAILDLVAGGVPRRFRAFVDEHAVHHVYMAHVGAGWAIARCPWGALTFLPRLDPLLKWLTVDGIGFHAAFFRPALVLEGGGRSLLRACGAEAYDSGLGRALWFAAGAQPPLAMRGMAGFAEVRRPALWTGLGLAVSYVGGASNEELHDLKRAAGACAPRLAVGAAFAAKSRDRAGNAAEHTERACRVFCETSAADTAAIADACLTEARAAAGPFRRCIDLLAGRFGAPATGQT